MQSEERTRVRQSLLNQLAMRDYSVKELLDKHLAKGFAAQLILDQIADLQTLGLQDDARFAAAFLRMRVGQGKGLLIIRQELLGKGIDKSLIADLVDASEIDWRAEAIEVRERKFGASVPSTPKEKAKQLRFLASRGFSAAECYAALAATGEADDYSCY